MNFYKRLLPLILIFLAAQKSWAAKDICQAALAPSIQNELIKKEKEIRDVVRLYEEHLGPYQNPFAMIYTPHEATQLFQSMLTRKEDSRKVHSPLAMIDIHYKKNYVQMTPIQWKVIQAVLDDARKLIKNNRSDLLDLQSDLYALNRTLEYIRQYKTPEAIVNRDGESNGEKEESDDDSYPTLPKEYNPQTKNTDDSGGKRQKPVQIAETNVKTPYWSYSHFNQIRRNADVRFREAILPIKPNNPPAYKRVEKYMKIRVKGTLNANLFVPPLYRPLQPDDPRAKIIRSESGGYILKLSESLNELTIPLVPETEINLNPLDRDILTETIGFSNDEWPEDVQINIIRKFSVELAKTNPLKVAQAISDYISKEYLYSVDEKPETDPIDALKTRAFQCDMAAYAMIGLLRDVYKIPSRVVGGFRGKIYRSGTDGKSYLMKPTEGHAWVEVFHNGRWHLFDSTPIKKDRKKDNDEEDPNDYSDVQLQHTLNPEEEKSKDPVKEKTKSDVNRDDLVKMLEIGSVDLTGTSGRNPLRDRALRTLLKIILDPTKRGSEIANKLNQMAATFRHFSHPQIRALYQEALSAHANEHPGLKEWLEELSFTIAKQNPNKSYQDLHKIILAVKVYSSLLDENTTKNSAPVPIKLIAKLEEIKNEIKKLAHADNDDIGIVQEFIKDLPMIPQMLLKNDYDFQSIGPNPPTKEIAKHLKDGKLNDLRLLALLSRHADFILNSFPRPEYQPIKTWVRNMSKPRGQDILPLQRYSEIPRALLGQPDKDIEENIAEGTAYSLVRKQKINLPLSKGIEEAERITVVLYDTSGSMNGWPGKFQAGLISAFVTKALSDISPSGRHRHKVVVIPFDDNPGNPMLVTNTQEALELIRNYHAKLKNTGRNTNIQKALLQALALIADAEKRNGEPLAAANILLMTDGQADVNINELIRARNAIDRETPLQVMFAAINQTNEDLKKFANESTGTWAAGGFYREFTTKDIEDSLQEASSLISKNNAFYTDKMAKDVPNHIVRLMNEAAALARDFSTDIFYGNQYLPAKEHLAQLDRLKWTFIKNKDRPIEGWIAKLRQFLENDPAFKDHKIREKIADDIMNNFKELTGLKNMNDLSSHEHGHLRQLLEFAAGVPEKP